MEDMVEKLLERIELTYSYKGIYKEGESFIGTYRNSNEELYEFIVINTSPARLEIYENKNLVYTVKEAEYSSKIKELYERMAKDSVKNYI